MNGNEMTAKLLHDKLESEMGKVQKERKFVEEQRKLSKVINKLLEK